MTPSRITATVPDVIAKLEQLDDTIFGAINGDPDALDSSLTAWIETVDELGPEIVEESRRQYLRCAKDVWQRHSCQPHHPPHKSFAALEIISLLSE